MRFQYETHAHSGVAEAALRATRHNGFPGPLGNARANFHATDLALHRGGDSLPEFAIMSLTVDDWVFPTLLSYVYS